MLGVGIRSPEDVTLLGGPNHIRHIKSQSFKNAYDEAIITEWLIGKMGHVALPIWDAILATKNCEGTGGGRFLGWASWSKDDQTLWRSSRWGRQSLLDPDIFRRIGVATLLRRRIKNGSSRKYHSRTRGSTCLSTELRNPRAFSLTEPCSNNVAEYNALLIRMQITDEIGVKNFEAHGDSKLIVNQVHEEYEVKHKDLISYHKQLST